MSSKSNKCILTAEFRIEKYKFSFLVKCVIGRIILPSYKHHHIIKRDVNNACRSFHMAIVPMTLNYNYIRLVQHRMSTFWMCYTNILPVRFHFFVPLTLYSWIVPGVTSRDWTMSFCFRCSTNTNKNIARPHDVHGPMDCQSPNNSYGMGSAKYLLHGIKILFLNEKKNWLNDYLRMLVMVGSANAFFSASLTLIQKKIHNGNGPSLMQMEFRLTLRIYSWTKR